MGKILVVDDERAIRRALREILEFEEFEVSEAENGKQGLDMAKAEEFDIIFCDIKIENKWKWRLILSLICDEIIECSWKHDYICIKISKKAWQINTNIKENKIEKWRKTKKR